MQTEQERLAAFERVWQALNESQEDTVRRMDELRGQGKVNSATFRQLMGRKVNNDNMLSLFKLYGIE